MYDCQSEFIRRPQKDWIDKKIKFDHTKINYLLVNYRIKLVSIRLFAVCKILILEI